MSERPNIGPDTLGMTIEAWRALRSATERPDGLLPDDTPEVSRPWIIKYGLAVADGEHAPRLRITDYGREAVAEYRMTLARMRQDGRNFRNPACSEAMEHGPADAYGKCPWCGVRYTHPAPRPPNPGVTNLTSAYEYFYPEGDST